MYGYTAALICSARFHSLAACAARNGGFWVSASGGTANVVAGVIARELGIGFDQALKALDSTGSVIWKGDWYQAMAEAQPWPLLEIPEAPRWDTRTIARAACRY